MNIKKHFTIIGGGLAACAVAAGLAKKGHKVTIYESLKDPRKTSIGYGKSYNVQLYIRGIHALKKLGLWDNEIKKISAVVKEYHSHYPNSEIQKTSVEKKEIIYQVHRDILHKLLIKKVDAYKNVTFVFNKKCIGIDRKSKIVYFQDTKTKKITRVKTDVIIGADGVNSVVRESLQRGRNTYHRTDIFPWGYKEIHHSSEEMTNLHFSAQATHKWSQDTSLLIGFPNYDGSLSLLAMLPYIGEKSFKTLHSQRNIEHFVKEEWPDLASVASTITKAFIKNPIGKFVTIITEPWFYKDFIVITGDAAHGIVPFFGLGMNAAYEDAVMLTNLIEKYPYDLEKAFATFYEQRKQHIDILAGLAKENFTVLRDLSRSPYHLAKGKVQRMLHKLFPSLFLPEMYKMLLHTNEPYGDIWKKFIKQELVFRYSGLNMCIYSIAILYSFKGKVNVLKLKLKQMIKHIRTPQVIPTYPTFTKDITSS